MKTSKHGLSDLILTKQSTTRALPLVIIYKTHNALYFRPTILINIIYDDEIIIIYIDEFLLSNFQFIIIY